MNTEIRGEGIKRFTIYVQIEALIFFYISKVGITQVSAGSINGSLQCTFTRVRNITRNISDTQTHHFDLVDNVYHILMAVGSVQGQFSLTNITIMNLLVKDQNL